VPELAGASQDKSWELQFLIENVDIAARRSLVDHFQGKVAWCCMHRHAHHVILSLIAWNEFTRKTPVTSTCIFTEFCANLQILSTHKFGCQVGRDLFKHCDTHLKPLVEALDFDVLCKSEFGKRVAVAVLNRSVEGREDLLAHVQSHLEMCEDEHGATVVASALMKNGCMDDEEMDEEMVNKLLSQNGLIVRFARSRDGFTSVEKLLKDHRYTEVCVRQLTEGLSILTDGKDSKDKARRGKKIAKIAKILGPTHDA
jgi:hypothetical protein